MMVDEDGKIMWDTMSRVVQYGVRFLDDVIDCAWWPIDEITENAKRDRNIGLGVMGFADMLIKMGIPYDSEEGIATGYSVMKFISKVAEAESISMGDGHKKNVTLTSIAPTGSRAFIANCTPGIEPVFGIVSVNNTMIGSFYNVHPLFEERAKEAGVYDEDILDKIFREGTLQTIDGIPDELRGVFKTATDIDYRDHIKMQAAWQENVDTAISKTINLPHDATVEDVKDAFMLAYDLGCKSTTVYRDGSREIQPMENKTDNHTCPECGDKLRPKEGCWSCENCGYSLCSLM